MKKNVVFMMGMLIIVIAFGFSVFGCASTGNNKAEPGVLTITGIPAEFEGKYISFSFDMGANYKPKLEASASDPRELFVGRKTAAVIKDSTASLMIFEDKPFIGLQAFTGSVTIPVELCIRDTADSMQAVSTVGRDVMPDFIFDSVTFENGNAEIIWNNPIIPGVITITGIPSQYHEKSATIVIGLNRYNPFIASGTPGRGGYMSSDIIYIGGVIAQGNVTAKIYKQDRNNYMNYNFSGTKDIIVAIPNGKESSAIVTIGADPSYDYFIFRGVQINNGEAAINFNQGSVL